MKPMPSMSPKLWTVTGPMEKRRGYTGSPFRGIGDDDDEFFPRLGLQDDGPLGDIDGKGVLLAVELGDGDLVFPAELGKLGFVQRRSRAREGELGSPQPVDVEADRAVGDDRVDDDLVPEIRKFVDGPEPDVRDEALLALLVALDEEEAVLDREDRFDPLALRHGSAFRLRTSEARSSRFTGPSSPPAIRFIAALRAPSSRAPTTTTNSADW